MLEPLGDVRDLSIVLDQVGGIEVGAGLDERCADEEIEERLVLTDPAAVDAFERQVAQCPGGRMRLERRGWWDGDQGASMFPETASRAQRSTWQQRASS